MLDQQELIPNRPKDRKIQVMVYLQGSLIPKIDEAAAQAGMSRSAFINEVMARYIKLAESQPDK